MNLFSKPLFTTIGAGVLTVVAATAALAVNAGILQSAPDNGVGNLESVATVPVDVTEPGVRYLTFFVDETISGDTAVSDTDATSSVTPTSIPGGAADGFSDDGEFDDHEGDDDEFGEDDDDSADHEDGNDSEDHEDGDEAHEEYEGADDDD